MLLLPWQRNLHIFLPQLDTWHVLQFKSAYLITLGNNCCSDIDLNYVVFGFIKMCWEPPYLNSLNLSACIRHHLDL